MARDRLFFRAIARTNAQHVPAAALVAQGIWAALLTLPRTVSTDAAGAVRYGNVYTQLLEYIVAADLVFYVLLVAAVIVLRRKDPEMPARIAPGATRSSRSSPSRLATAADRRSGDPRAGDLRDRIRHRAEWLSRLSPLEIASLTSLIDGVNFDQTDSGCIPDAAHDGREASGSALEVNRRFVKARRESAHKSPITARSCGVV